MNNLKTKADDLDVSKLKTVPVDFKKLSETADNKFVKKYKVQHTKSKSK